MFESECKESQSAGCQSCTQENNMTDSCLLLYSTLMRSEGFADVKLENQDMSKDTSKNYI